MPENKHKRFYFPLTLCPLATGKAVESDIYRCRQVVFLCMVHMNESGRKSARIMSNVNEFTT